MKKHISGSAVQMRAIRLLHPAMFTDIPSWAENMLQRREVGADIVRHIWMWCIGGHGGYQGMHKMMDCTIVSQARAR
jgi:hypothetical protein